MMTRRRRRRMRRREEEEVDSVHYTYHYETRYLLPACGVGTTT